MKKKWVVTLGLIGAAVAAAIKNSKSEEEKNKDKKYITIENQENIK